MSTLTLDSLVHFYAPFQRIDAEERIVEGYCYTSPRVKGDKWNLKRAALEKAAARYMEMPAVRSMHQPIAAGKGLGIQWDEKGCLLRAKIVDENEWNKVREGVYRGFSLGGRPLVARGNNIEDFEWIETSLVDRPCDPGALFTVVRAEGDVSSYSVEIIDDESADAEDAGAGDLSRTDYGIWSGNDFESGEGGEMLIQADAVDVPPAELVAASAVVEEATSSVGLSRTDTSSIHTPDHGLTPSQGDIIGRWQEPEPDRNILLNRAEAAESALSVVRADLETTRGELNSLRHGLSSAEEEVRRLRALPRERKGVIGYTAGLPRHFAVNDLLPPDRAVRRGELEAERDKMLAVASEEIDAHKRADVVKRILAIEHTLACL